MVMDKRERGEAKLARRRRAEMAAAEPEGNSEPQLHASAERAGPGIRKAPRRRMPAHRQQECLQTELVEENSRDRASDALSVYRGSDAGRTRSYLCRLAKLGPLGRIAAELFRAQKASSRAKQYRGGLGRHGPRYRDLSYERKDVAIGKLCEILVAQAQIAGIKWGWGEDADAAYPDVLYVALPGIGQVSFHALHRHDGPDYPGEWDRTHASESRIVAFCDAVVEVNYQAAAPTPAGRKGHSTAGV